MILDYIALGVIVFMMIGATAVIVVLGSLPGYIAQRRGHPWPAAVAVAGWIGLLTAVMWPLALVWAFLPIPASPQDSPSDGPDPPADMAALKQQVADLRLQVEKLQSPGTDS